MGANVLLTGAAGGLGRAIARSLAETGRRLILVDRDRESLASFAAEIGGDVHAITLDVTDDERVDRLLEGIPDAFGPVDVLVNNAGHDVGGHKPFAEGSPDDWAGIVQTNLIGTMRVTRAVLPSMLKRNAGHIVNVSSTAAVRKVPNMAAYSASKAGLRMFTEILRGEVAETAIRVTEIQPGLTRTGIILNRYRGDPEKTKAYFDQFSSVLEPEDVARTITFALDQPPHVQIAEILVLPINRF